MKRSGTFLLLALFLAGMIVLPVFHHLEAHPHAHAHCGCEEPADRPVDDTPPPDDCPVCHLAAAALQLVPSVDLTPILLARTDLPIPGPSFICRPSILLSDGPARAPPFVV